MLESDVSDKKRRSSIPLADLLVERGDFENADMAARWVLAGRVYVNGQVATQSRVPVNRTAEIVVKGLDRTYASRGGLKLEWGLKHFDVSADGLVALDAGASAGGFTDCLLRHGARRVYAVDVGYGQFVGRLSCDPRVVNLERTNISDLSREQLQPPIDMCVVDLSYLSLTKALPILARLFVGRVRIICLIKPLFEGVTPELKSDATDLARALRDLQTALTAVNLALVDVTSSPIRGTQGTVEFLGLVDSQSQLRRDFDTVIDEAVRQAVSRDASGG